MPYFFLLRIHPKSWKLMTAPLYEVEKLSNCWWLRVSNYFDEDDVSEESLSFPEDRSIPPVAEV